MVIYEKQQNQYITKVRICTIELSTLRHSNAWSFNLPHDQTSEKRDLLYHLIKKLGTDEYITAKPSNLQ